VDLGNQIGGALSNWLASSEHHATHRKPLHLVTWMNSTSWSCTTAGIDAGSPMLYLQVCQITICWYLNHTGFRNGDTRSTVIRPLVQYPRLAKRKNPTSRVDMEMFLERPSAEPWSCSAIAIYGGRSHVMPLKGENNRHIAGKFGIVASSERCLFCKTTLTNFCPVVLEAQPTFPLHR
jgi:hypothetical protein